MNGAVQELLVQRTEPADSVRCPQCTESVVVGYDERTHTHHLVAHGGCVRSRTPVAFVPGKFAVVAVIWNPNRDGTLLAVSRKNNFEDFGLPGGKADPIGEGFYEDPLTALKREVREETSLVVKRARYVYWRKDYSMPGDTRPMLPALCFLVEGYEGEPQRVEAGRVEWVPPSVVAAEKCSFHEYNRGLFDALFIPYEE